MGESDSWTGTGFGLAPARRHRRGGLAVDDRAGLGRVPLLHPLEATLLRRRKALALDGVDVETTGRSAASASPGPGAARHVMAVDDSHVGEVELLEQQPGCPVGLERRLDLGAEALDPAAETERQLCQAALDILAGVVPARIEPEVVEVAGERADVRRDRHPVVVEDDHDRGLQAARLLQGLVGDAAGQRPVTDHRDHLAVGADAAAHRLLEPDRVADRGRGVAGAHDVVLGFGNRAERGEAAVLADRLQASRGR